MDNPSQFKQIMAEFHRIRSMLFILIITFIASGVALIILQSIQSYNRQQIYLATEAAMPTHKVSQLAGAWKVYSNNSFSFSYPEKLTLSESSGVVKLEHEVPFKNTGECDMKGDDITYDKLNDFRAAFQVYSGNVAQAVKHLSPYMSEENFTSDSLKISPGFIDEYQIGNLKGFAIYEGAEGCGHTIYYFSVSQNKTFVATKDMVQLLSGVISSNKPKELLKVPGVIQAQESKNIFEQMLLSFKFIK